MGRNEERKNGTLKQLGAFESVQIKLSLELSDDISL